MRFIHTADWHLGRLFHGLHLTEDQAHLLEQFVALVKDCKPDAILISGDIYDRAMPPVDAVELLNETLTELVVDCDLPILMIAGNHDNPQRLGFGGRIMARQGLHVFGSLESADEPVRLCDEHGTVTFFAAPYCEPAAVRDHLDDDRVVCFDSAMRSLTGVYRSRCGDGERSVLLGHAFVSGGVASDSERPLSIGGVDTVGVNCFDGFSYTALGHLHQPQSFRQGQVRYSGSLMRYSFNEASQRKSISLVELDGCGEVSIEEMHLTPRREVRRVAGFLNDLLQNPDDYGPRDDYLMADLWDEGAIYDPIGRLREVFPNFLHLERTNLRTGDERRRTISDLAGKGDLELFDDFMDAMTGHRMTEAQQAAFIAAAEDVRRMEREVG